MFGRLPLTRARMQTTLDVGADGNAGPNPGAAAQQPFFDELGGSLTTLESQIAAGAYDADPDRRALAEATLTQGTQLFSDLFTLLGDPTTASPFIPTGSSEAGAALDSRLDALQTTLHSMGSEDRDHDHREPEVVPADPWDEAEVFLQALLDAEVHRRRQGTRRENHADRGGHQRLEEERQGDVERRGPDQPHDADLLAARERRQPDGVADQQHRGDDQEGDRQQGALLHGVHGVEDRADRLSLVPYLVDPVQADHRAGDAFVLVGSFSVIHTDSAMSSTVAAGLAPSNRSGPNSSLTFSNASALVSKR